MCNQWWPSSNLKVVFPGSSLIMAMLLVTVGESLLAMPHGIAVSQWHCNLHFNAVLSLVEMFPIESRGVGEIRPGFAGGYCINSFSPSTPYKRQWTGSELVQVMVCHLFGAKPQPEPMLTYSQLNSWEQISVKIESEFYHFHSRKCIWNVVC